MKKLTREDMKNLVGGKSATVSSGQQAKKCCLDKECSPCVEGISCLNNAVLTDC